jgi:hypothetical protein
VRGQRAPNEFAADTILYGFARAGGPVALQLLCGLCVAALALLLVARARPTAPRPLAIGFAALALMAAAPWFVVRPALFSFVLLAAFLLAIDRERAWWLPPLALVWANLHPFAVLAAPLALAWAASCWIERRALARRATLAAVATAVASLVSPFGVRLYTSSFAMATGTLGGVRALVTEWAPTTPSFLARYDLAIVVLALVAVVGLCVRRPPLFDAGLLLLAIVLGARAVRLLPLSAILVAPIAARQLAPALARARAAGALVVVLALATPLVVLATPGMRWGLGWDTENLPDAASRFIAANRPAGNVFNFEPFGGWLAWRLYPDVRVLIDGRTAHLFPPAFVERYGAAEHDPRAFAALAAEYDLQWAIVRARPGESFSEPIARDRRWTMVWLDDCAAVYVRNDGPNRALAERGYTLLRHLTQPPRGPVASNLQEALRHDAALAVAQDPPSLRARALAAAAGL